MTNRNLLVYWGEIVDLLGRLVSHAEMESSDRGFASDISRKARARLNQLLTEEDELEKIIKNQEDL